MNCPGGPVSPLSPFGPVAPLAPSPPVIGNGIGITHLEGANVFGEVANANYATYALFTLNSTQSNTTTTVIGNYQPNINQVGNLDNLNT